MARCRFHPNVYRCSSREDCSCDYAGPHELADCATRSLLHILGTTDPSERVKFINTLKRLVNELESREYKITSYGEITHTYKRSLVEKEIWRHNHLVGLSATTPLDWQTSIYNRLWEKAEAAIKGKRLPLAQHYLRGLAKLREVWKVKQFVRVCTAEGQLRAVRLECRSDQ